MVTNTLVSRRTFKLINVVTSIIFFCFYEFNNKKTWFEIRTIFNIATIRLSGNSYFYISPKISVLLACLGRRPKSRVGYITTIKPVVLLSLSGLKAYWFLLWVPQNQLTEAKKSQIKFKAVSFRTSYITNMLTETKRMRTNADNAFCSQIHLWRKESGPWREQQLLT